MKMNYSQLRSINKWDKQKTTFSLSLMAHGNLQVLLETQPFLPSSYREHLQEFYWDDVCPLAAVSKAEEESVTLRPTFWHSADIDKFFQNKTVAVKDSTVWE